MEKFFIGTFDIRNRVNFNFLCCRVLGFEQFKARIGKCRESYRPGEV